MQRHFIPSFSVAVRFVKPVVHLAVIIKIREAHERVRYIIAGQQIFSYVAVMRAVKPVVKRNHDLMQLFVPHVIIMPNMLKKDMGKESLRSK